MLEPLDFQLLYLIAETEKDSDQVISTWYLATNLANSPSDVESLDSVLRYRIKNLARKGLLKQAKYRKGNKTVSHYSLTPTKTLCVNGALFILDKPITIIACPYIESCTIDCKISAHKDKGEIMFEGCKLLNESPPELKETVYKHLSGNKKLVNGKNK